MERFGGCPIVEKWQAEHNSVKPLLSLTKVCRQLHSETARLPIALNVFEGTVPTVLKFLAGLNAKHLNQVSAVHMRIELMWGYDPFTVEGHHISLPKKDPYIRKVRGVLQKMFALENVRLDWVREVNNGAWHAAFKKWMQVVRPAGGCHTRDPNRAPNSTGKGAQQDVSPLLKRERLITMRSQLRTRDVRSIATGR